MHTSRQFSHPDCAPDDSSGMSTAVPASPAAGTLTDPPARIPEKSSTRFNITAQARVTVTTSARIVSGARPERLFEIGPGLDCGDELGRGRPDERGEPEVVERQHQKRVRLQFRVLP